MLQKIKFPLSRSLNLSKFLQARINVFIFKVFPYNISRDYLFILGILYYKFNKKEKILIERAITESFKSDKTPKEIKTLTHKIFRGIMSHYHEKLIIAYANYKFVKKRFLTWVDTEGEDEFKELIEKGKGILLVTGHYGAVEWLPGSLTARGYPVSMSVRFQTKELKKSLEARAKKMKHLQLLDVDEGNVFFTAINALKSGRILITECDEFKAWKVSKKLPVNFLNHDMFGDKALDVLKRYAGANVASVLMHRNSRFHYTMKLKTMIDDPSDKRSVSQVTLENLDKALKESPEQWYQWRDLGKKLFNS